MTRLRCALAALWLAHPSGRIHIDTWRHRTWGADHTSRSAFCAQEVER